MITLDLDLSQPQSSFINSDYPYTIFLGGRGSGKSFASILKLLTLPPNSRVMYLGPTHTFFQDVTIPEINKIDQYFQSSGLKLVKSHHSMNREITLITGTVIALRSVKNYEERRGVSTKYLFIDEAARISDAGFDVIAAILRAPDCRLFLTTTPKGKRSWLYRLVSKPHKPTLVIRSSTRDNKHIDSDYHDNMKSIYSTKFARQELEAEFVDDAAFIEASWIQRYESIEEPITTTFMAVDPAPSQDADADYSGFCVASRGVSGKIYVQYLDHFHLTLHQIVAKIEELYKLYSPSKILIESISFQVYLLQEIQRLRLPGYGLLPNRDKVARAMPAIGLCERGRLFFHSRVKEDIIDEILDFPEGPHDDAVDALAYATSELMKLKDLSGAKVIQPTGCRRR
jgi:predicted phage terminase large subunit-like protein